MPATIPHTFNDGPGNTASGVEVMDNFNAVNAGVFMATVTSLPASPVNGQDCFYLADATNGVVWHLKYRSASASAYKWEFVGGGAFIAAVNTSETTTSATFTNLTTAGPDVTVPLAGDYEYHFKATVSNAGGASRAEVGLAVGGVSPSSTGVDTSGVTLPTVGYIGSVSHFGRRNALTASTLLRVQYVGGGASNAFYNRALTVRPVRVG